jgi:hypothetical protein
VGSVVVIAQQIVVLVTTATRPSMQFLSCLGLRAADRQEYDLPRSFNLNAHVAQAKNATIVAVGKLPTPGWGPHPAKRANPVGTPPGTPALKARRRHPERRWRSGGADGNEILTSATAIVLVVLLVAGWITVVHMNGLIPTHMFIGLVLIPPRRAEAREHRVSNVQLLRRFRRVSETRATGPAAEADGAAVRGRNHRAVRERSAAAWHRPQVT